MPSRRTVLVGLSSGLLLPLFSGCAAPSITAPVARIESVRTVRVIGLGPVPLEVPPGMAGAWVAQLPKPSISVARGVLLLSSILMLAELPEAERRAAEGGRVVAGQLGGAAVWSPAMLLATETTQALGGLGRVALGPVEMPMPGMAPDDYQKDMGAYAATVKAWWGENRSTVAYTPQDVKDVDALLEVGLYYAAFFAGQLTLFVRIKLIDPATRDVIARAVRYDSEDVGTPEAALANEGREFKRLFSKLSASLVPRTLTELGFTGR